MDRAVARLLHVQPQPLVLWEAVATTSSWPFETALLVSAVRCILRYIVLPFVLPLWGIATGAALGILLTVDVIATIAIVATLRRLWRLQHPRRWQYLALAVLVGFFFMSDVRVLFV
jgi:ABC-type iron transport system FetAB permease component